MKYLSILFILALACTPSKQESTKEEPASIVKPVVDPQVFELRTYYAAEGKLEDLVSRFRDHTFRLFEKHGVVNIAYWTPIENNENTLVYLIGFESRAERDSSFKSFAADEEWKEAYEASRVNGKLVDSISNTFLTYTDYSPKLEKGDLGPRVFERRTYYTNDGKLENLHSRFRDHTMSIFEESGMTNVAYFNLLDEEENNENTLLYFISHPDTASIRTNWTAFGQSERWKEVYQASIEDGKIVNNIDKEYLQTVDFSPIK